MPKGSVELTNARREEIIAACEMLYQTMSFKEITLKDIAGATSFTRTSIYNYFQTKEEIFLALMQKEYERWVEELDAMANAYTTMSVESFSSMLAHSLEKRNMLLKLLSMNHFDMEENSRPECLLDFKRAYGASIEAVRVCLAKFFQRDMPLLLQLSVQNLGVSAVEIDQGGFRLPLLHLTQAAA